MYSNPIQQHGDIKSNIQIKQSSSNNQEKVAPVEVNDDYSDSERSSENDSDTGNLSSDDNITLYKSPTKKFKKDKFAVGKTEDENTKNIPIEINNLMESCIDLEQVIGSQVGIA